MVPAISARLKRKHNAINDIKKYLLGNVFAISTTEVGKVNFVKLSE